MSIKDDMIEQDMLDKDICFICHEQNHKCECNNPSTYLNNGNDLLTKSSEPTTRMATLSIPHDNS